MRTLLVALVLLSLPLRAWALLQVFPTRVVLDDKKRVTTISLRHIGKKPGQYRITAVYYRMKPDGTLELMPKPEGQPNSIAKMLRFSPRETTIPPNMEQVVRVMFAGPRDMAEGDYRAHLHFEPIGDAEGIETTTQAGSINLALQARLALAIPVIYHRGKANFTVALANPKFVALPDKSKGLSVQMQVQGKGFPYGDMVAYFSPEGKSEEQIGIIRGIAAYIPQRAVTLALKPPKDFPLSNGKLRVEYREPEEQGAKVLGTVEANMP